MPQRTISSPSPVRDRGSICKGAAAAWGSLLLLASLSACDFNISSLGRNGAVLQTEGTRTQDFKEERGHVRMNDVSILFPLAKTQTEFENGYLPASATGPGGILFPEDFMRAGSAIGGLGGSAILYSDLRVVAMRWDPCFGALGPITGGSDCQNQLRLVFQPLNLGTNGLVAKDSAIHVFYSLSREQWDEGVKEVVALRERASRGSRFDDDGPLAVHPILSAQGMDGMMASGLNAIILKYADPRSIVRFTQLEATNTGFTWNFSGFDIVEGSIRPIVIPSAAEKPTFVSTIFSGFAVPIDGFLSPLPAEAADDFSILLNATKAKAATTEGAQEAFDATFAVENPNIHSPNSADCASCHAAEIARVQIGQEVLHLSPSEKARIFAVDSESIPAAALGRTTPVNSRLGLNVHAFSYRGTEPMINQRVVNETAAVVVFANGRP